MYKIMKELIQGMEDKRDPCGTSLFKVLEHNSYRLQEVVNTTDNIINISCVILFEQTIK